MKVSGAQRKYRNHRASFAYCLFDSYGAVR